MKKDQKDGEEPITDEKTENHTRKKPHWLLALLVLTAGLVLCLWCNHSVEETENWFYLGLAGAGVLALITLIPGKVPKPISILFMIGFPIASFYLLEWLTHDPSTIRWSVQALEYIFYFLLFLFCFFLTGRMQIGYAIAVLFVGFVGIANYYVIDFRSSPILPWDLTSAGTAMSVLDNFVFKGSYTLMIIVLGFAAMIILSLKSSIRLRFGKVRVIFTLLMAILMGVFVYAVQTDEVIDLCSIYEMPFTQGYTYKKNGFFVSFLVNARYLNVEKPEGYSVSEAEAILEEYSADGNSADTSVSSEMPNIIVIMDEAFSDLSVLGDFETSEEVMPFINSLKEDDNTISGHLYVSVLGGNTANTEFEFLTGSSMAFLPAGSVPYQQFLKEETPSLASILKTYGYRTMSLHPYSASGWNRYQVYPLLGFDRMLFKSDFTEKSVIRNYITDAAMVRQIIAEYENRDKSSPLFLFGVTMQNHGSYSKDYNNFTPYITVTSPDLGSLPKTEKYLTLINLTDDAIQDLIEYFQTQDEKTIIVFFGDHQPTLLESKFFKSLFGKSTSSLTWEEQVPRYEVPYFIWANYDIEGEQNVDLSANYLSSLLMDVAGLEKTEYQEYLSQLREKYPVITAGFYMDAEGNLYEMTEEAVAENQDLWQYSVLQYNDLFDTENRLDGFLKAEK